MIRYLSIYLSIYLFLTLTVPVTSLLSKPAKKLITCVYSRESVTIIFFLSFFFLSSFVIFFLILFLNYFSLCNFLIFIVSFVLYLFLHFLIFFLQSCFILEWINLLSPFGFSFYLSHFLQYFLILFFLPTFNILLLLFLFSSLALFISLSLFFFFFFFFLFYFLQPNFQTAIEIPDEDSSTFCVLNTLMWISIIPRRERNIFPKQHFFLSFHCSFPSTSNDRLSAVFDCERSLHFLFTLSFSLDSFSL